MSDGSTKDVLEAGLEAEMSEHLGYDKYDPAGRNKGNSRNGTRAKPLLTDVGPGDVDGPTIDIFEVSVDKGGCAVVVRL